MIHIHKSNDRFPTQLGWLDSRHSFSFANHYDPERMGFRSLRVINEDRVGPSAGFGQHPHRDMEILSIVLSGSLAHRDSLGNGSVLSAGDVQRITAGTGVLHSEMNPSADEPVHFLQIWIMPEKNDLTPGYEERHIEPEEMERRLVLVASRNPRQDALKIHQDVDLYATQFDQGGKVHHPLQPGRHAWVQVVSGEIELNGQSLGAGDGAAVSDESEINLTGIAAAKAIVFDLA